MEEEVKNPTGGEEQVELHSGGQEGAVDLLDNPVDDGQGEVVDPQENAEAPQQENVAQSREDNAAARAARIRAAQETEGRLRKQYDEDVAGLGVVNPYTGKPIRSFQEFKEYGAQFQRERLKAEAERQGRPVDELVEEQENRAYVARKRQEEREQKEAMKQLRERQDFMIADVAAFVEKYPDVDVAELEQNPKFRKFAGKRLYQEPLAELYKDFVELVSDTERAAAEKAAGKRDRSTGSGQGGGGAVLSPEQERELAEWNRSNPNMKMTAKEFLGM